MLIFSTNLLSKDHLDAVPISITNAKFMSTISDSRSNSIGEVDDLLMNNFIEDIETTLDEIIEIFTHARFYVCVSAELPCKV